MALNITINKVSVAASFAAGATVATAVASGGTTPYIYSLATGGDKFAINSSTGVITTIAAMDITNIASFSVTATDSTTGTALTGTSDVTYPPIQAAIRSKFDRTNVIYKITRDIDLGHGILTIPAGCTLDFQGGTITNGTIVGNSTKINAGLQKIFDINTVLTGSWNISNINVKWFGAKGDGITDDTIAIQSAISSFPKVYFPNGKYVITSPINFTRNYSLIDYYKREYIDQISIEIIGENKTNTIINNKGNGYAFIIDGNVNNTSTTSTLLGQSNNILSNIQIIGDGVNNGVYLNSITGLIISNIFFKNIGNAIVFGGSNPPDAGTTSNIDVSNCQFMYCNNGIVSEISRISGCSISSSIFRYIHNWAISLTSIETSIKGCSISSCGNNDTNNSGGIKIFTGVNASLNRGLEINNCEFEANKWQDILLNNIHGGIISSCIFHPYYSIPTGSNNEQVCINVNGDLLNPKQSGESYGVRAVDINGCRMQSPSIPTGEVNRFLKVTGHSDRINLNSLSLLIDSQFENCVYTDRDFVTNFKNKVFPPVGKASLVYNSNIGGVTGDGSVAYFKNLSEYTVIDFDLSSGVDGAGVVKGGCFNTNKDFVAPYNGYYKVDAIVNINNPNNKTVVLGINGATIIRTQTNSNCIVSSCILPLLKGQTIQCFIVASGGEKDITFSSDYTPFSFSVEAI